MASVREARPAPGQTRSDLADQVREMRATERAQRAAAEDEAAREPSVGHEARRSARFERKLRGSITSSAGGTAAGAALGAFAYFLGVAYLRGGPAGAKSWLAAKFVNKPSGTLTSVPLSAGGTASPANASGTTAGASSGLVVPTSQGQPSEVLV